MGMEPHELRCETCNVTQCKNNPNNPAAYYWRDRKEKCMYPSVQSIQEFTAEYGCASHSNASKKIEVIEEWRGQ
jgi:hypothetical protein